MDLEVSSLETGTIATAVKSPFLFCPVQLWKRGEFEVSTDAQRIDAEAVYKFLFRSYWWRPGASKELITKSLQTSLCFGLYRQNHQIGLARVVTDYVHFAYLMDVYVDGPEQQNGLGTWLMECALAHPELKTVKWLLATRTAQEFYERLGFKAVAFPGNLMEIPAPLL